MEQENLEQDQNKKKLGDKIFGAHNNPTKESDFDENFEIDQVMTLAECDLTNSENNSTNDIGNCIYSVDF